MMAAFRSAMVLLGKDDNAAAYIEAYRNIANPAALPVDVPALPADVRGRLSAAVIARGR